MSGNQGGARKKVRADDARGGARESTRPDARTRGPRPDLVAAVRGVGTSLSHHQHKFDQAELRELQDATGALLQQIRLLLLEVEEWTGEIL